MDTLTGMESAKERLCALAQHHPYGMFTTTVCLVDGKLQGWQDDVAARQLLLEGKAEELYKTTSDYEQEADGVGDKVQGRYKIQLTTYRMV